MMTDKNLTPQAQHKHAVAIYWFRRDLRLEDNPALLKACSEAQSMVFVYCHAAQQTTRWGFPRLGVHQAHFIDAALAELKRRLNQLGNDLLEIDASASDGLPQLAKELHATAIYCEEIAAPEEENEVTAIRHAGIEVNAFWQSSMLSPADLPFTINQLPEVFTQCRTLIEKAAVVPPAPYPAPMAAPPLPVQYDAIAHRWKRSAAPNAMPPGDPRSSFPYTDARFLGHASAAQRHLQQYLQRKLAHTYKETRNQLTGIDYSTKFSPWLACGALSARQIYQALKEFESEHGANPSSYWIWFELLWRDYFRLLHLQYGQRLYTARGLSQLPPPSHNTAPFKRWCEGQTGEALVDAGMIELATTGYLSNRLRQIVASYLIYDLGCDWRAGAAWFEAQLVDYDVYSNQGNWLYIAGRGTDPRNGRRFNVQKQVHDHDRDGTYRRLWLGD